MMDMAQIEKVGVAFGTSAVFVGALGGLLRAFNKKMNIKDTIIRILSGSIVSGVTAPAIYTHFNEEWHSVLIFLVGYCGMEGVAFIVEVARKVGERHAEAIVERIFGKNPDDKE